MTSKTVANARYIGRDVPDEIAFPLMRARIESRVVKTEAGCWEWQGTLSWNGYPDIGFRGKNWRGNRLAIMLWKEPVPKGMDACHTCDNRKCLNPDHLWIGTRKQNHRDSVNKGRHYRGNLKFCKHGHEFTPENTYYIPNGRACKTCGRIKCRIRMGWTREEAENTPPVPAGYSRFSCSQLNGSDSNE
jgi:hypothetical protein